MKVEFDVKITAAILYDYMLTHTYSGFSGLFGLAVGILLIAGFCISSVIYYLAAGIVILLYIPCSLFLRAKRQAATNAFFKQPIHYILSDEGITVMQGEEEMAQPWAAIVKACTTRKSILLYTSKVNAWIFPKKDLGEKKEEVISMISTHVAPDRMKIKQ